MQTKADGKKQPGKQVQASQSTGGETAVAPIINDYYMTNMYWLHRF